MVMKQMMKKRSKVLVAVLTVGVWVWVAVMKALGHSMGGVFWWVVLTPFVVLGFVKLVESDERRSHNRPGSVLWRRVAATGVVAHAFGAEVVRVGPRKIGPGGVVVALEEPDDFSLGELAWFDLVFDRAGHVQEVLDSVKHYSNVFPEKFDTDVDRVVILINAGLLSFDDFTGPATRERVIDRADGAAMRILVERQEKVDALASLLRRKITVDGDCLREALGRSAGVGEVGVWWPRS
jgi:hypothetical protein